jgi:hypothetical protein
MGSEKTFDCPNSGEKGEVWEVPPGIENPFTLMILIVSLVLFLMKKVKQTIDDGKDFWVFGTQVEKRVPRTNLCYHKDNGGVL